MSVNLGPIRIKIVSWDKYNYRKGVKNPSWFRFQHSFFESPHFYSLTTEEKMCWIYLLCQQSKMVDPTESEMNANSHQLSFPFEPIHFVRNTGIKLEVMHQALLKLQKERLLEVIDDQHATLVIHARHTDVTRVLHECDTDVSQMCATLQDITLQNKEHIRAPDAVASGPMTHELMEIWNENCDTLPKSKGMNSKRVKAANARWREKPDREYWVKIVKLISQSPFCKGGGKNSWRATFDWFLKPDTHLKALEGQYGSTTSDEEYWSKMDWGNQK